MAAWSWTFLYLKVTKKLLENFPRSHDLYSTLFICAAISHLFKDVVSDLSSNWIQNRWCLLYVLHGFLFVGTASLIHILHSCLFNCSFSLSGWWFSCSPHTSCFCPHTTCVFLLDCRLALSPFPQASLPPPHPPLLFVSFSSSSIQCHQLISFLSASGHATDIWLDCCRFPRACSVQHALTHYVDITSPPTPQLIKLTVGLVDSSVVGADCWTSLNLFIELSAFLQDFLSLLCSNNSHKEEFIWIWTKYIFCVVYCTSTASYFCLFNRFNYLFQKEGEERQKGKLRN